MLDFIISAIILFGLWFGAKKILKRDLTGEIILGLFLGFFWEILTNAAWNYNPNLTTIYIANAEIPLMVITSWSFVLASSVLLANYLKKKLFGPHSNRLYFFATGLFSIFVIGFFSEVIGITTGAWTYPNVVEAGIIKLGLFLIPVRVAFGWMFFGSLFLAFIRLYQRDVEVGLEKEEKVIEKKIKRSLK